MLRNADVGLVFVERAMSSVKPWFCALMLFFSWQTGFAAEPVEYVFARAPQQSARATVEAWAPVLKRISADAGIALKLKVYDSREKFEGDFLGGQPDFAFGNPLYAVMGHKQHGYIPLLRDDGRKLTGIIVVRKDSNIENVSELAGKTIAFPDPNAMAASLYPRALLAEKFGLSFSTIYLGVHENVYRAVFFGKADAGGGIPATFEAEPVELRSQLRVIFETPAVASHPLLVHPRVSEQTRKQVSGAFLNLMNDENGRALLAAIKMTKPVLADFERDYADIMDLDLQSRRVKSGVGGD